MHELGCPKACRIFPDRGSNLCPLHWQEDSLPLDHRGKSRDVILSKCFQEVRAMFPWSHPSNVWFRAAGPTGFVEAAMTLLRSLPLSWSPAVSNAEECPQVLPTPSPSGALGIQHLWCMVAKQPSLSRTMNFTYKTPRGEAISQPYWRGGFPSQEDPRGPVQRPGRAQVIRFSLCLWLGSILCLSVPIC